ncbi:C4-dicarboxylate ABC transporter [Candidatus Woesearchaeota archaeon]|nr:MAG: C4-dicarboxylate ABC transporter [Candidatus Woesearchaeota archaeon]
MKTSNIKVNRLEEFTISFLAILLGMIGFSLAYLKAEHVLGFPFHMSSILLYTTIALSAVIFILYFLKWIKYPKSVKKELDHPIKLNFFPILAKLFLIASIIYVGTNFILAKYLWWIGVFVQSFFTLYIMSLWIRHSKFEIKHINPSWFIPIVGNILIPIAGVQFISKEVSWFFFSIGLIWWVVLFTIVVNRMIFFNPIPDKLLPTFFILFAPPAIGFISLTKLVGEVTDFGRILYYFALFMFILIMFQANLFTKIKFYLSWWAYSFPVVALTVATILMYEKTQLLFFNYLSWGLFIFLNLVIILLIVKTIGAVKKKKICIAEED